MSARNTDDVQSCACLYPLPVPLHPPTPHTPLPEPLWRRDKIAYVLLIFCLKCLQSFKTDSLKTVAGVDYTSLLSCGQTL